MLTITVIAFLFSTHHNNYNHYYLNFHDTHNKHMYSYKHNNQHNHKRNLNVNTNASNDINEVIYNCKIANTCSKTQICRTTTTTTTTGTIDTRPTIHKATTGAPTREQTNVQPRIELLPKNNANNIMCSNYKYQLTYNDNQQDMTPSITSTREVLPPIKESQLPTIANTTNTRTFTGIYYLNSPTTTYSQLHTYNYNQHLILSMIVNIHANFAISAFIIIFNFC